MTPSTSRYTVRVLGAAPLMRLPVVIAEVLDKEPSLTRIWLSPLLLAGFGVLPLQKRLEVAVCLRSVVYVCRVFRLDRPVGQVGRPRDS